MSEPRRRLGADAVRMRDVAAAAGVSVMTVSRALREPERLSADTRKAVLDAIEKIGYVPNRIAANLASARSSAVGQIVPSIQNSLYVDTVKGTADVLRSAGMQVMIADSGYSLEDEEALIGAFIAQRVSGLILHNTEHTPRAVEMMRRSGVPVIETGDLTRRPVDMNISYSNFNAAKAMTLHLAEQGYETIGFVSLVTRINRRARERQRGFLAALRALGRPQDPRLIMEVPPGMAAGANAMIELKSRVPAVDAIFFAGDVLAVGALMETQRRRWAIPRQMAIAGFDDLEILQHAVPRVTCLRLPRLEIGRRSAETLLERLHGKAGRVRLDLGFEVIHREST